MTREVEQPIVETVATGVQAGAIRETHPAFGIATIHRSSNTPGSVLFQSDLRHSETIHLAVHRTDRTRDLAHDWTHPGAVLLEVELSLAQWGALISSQGIGGGVPVTIRTTETEWNVPGLPYQPRIAESIAEVRGEARKFVEKANETLADLNAAIAGGRIGEIKKAAHAHALSIEHLESNSQFYVKSMADAVEKVVSNARADIEAHVLGAQRLVGSASIEAPAAPVLEVES